MAPATLRFGERPTAARVVRRRFFSPFFDRWPHGAIAAELAARDPLTLQLGRFRPVRAR